MKQCSEIILDTVFKIWKSEFINSIINYCYVMRSILLKDKRRYKEYRNSRGFIQLVNSRK